MPETQPQLPTEISRGELRVMWTIARGEQVTILKGDVYRNEDPTDVEPRYTLFAHFAKGRTEMEPSMINAPDDQIRLKGEENLALDLDQISVRGMFSNTQPSERLNILREAFGLAPLALPDQPQT